MRITFFAFVAGFGQIAQGLQWRLQQLYRNAAAGWSRWNIFGPTVPRPYHLNQPRREDGPITGVDGVGISGNVTNKLLAQMSPDQDFVDTRWQIGLGKLFKGLAKGGDGYCGLNTLVKGKLLTGML